MPLSEILKARQDLHRDAGDSGAGDATQIAQSPFDSITSPSAPPAPLTIPVPVPPSRDSLEAQSDSSDWAHQQTKIVHALDLGSTPKPPPAAARAPAAAPSAPRSAAFTSKAASPGDETPAPAARQPLPLKGNYFDEEEDVKVDAGPKQSAPAVAKLPEPAAPPAKAPEPANTKTAEVKAAMEAARPLAKTGEARLEKKPPRNQVIVFFSCKGGAGTTALSINTAHAYAGDGHQTCLVDLDLQLGDVLAGLGLAPRLTLAQAIENAARGEVLRPAALARHSSGVNVLSQVGSLDDLDKISSEGIATLVEGMRSTFDIMVVDGVRDFSDNVLAVLDVADRICIVAVQEVLAVRRARWAVGILRKIGFDPKDIAVCINRFDPESDISIMTLRKVFEPSQVMVIPLEAKLVLQSLNRGIPLRDLNPTHTLTRNIHRMAQNLAEGDGAQEVTEATVVRKGQPGVLDSIAFWRKS